MVYKTDFDYAQEEHHQEIVELLKKGVNKANKSANVIKLKIWLKMNHLNKKLRDQNHQHHRKKRKCYQKTENSPTWIW